MTDITVIAALFIALILFGLLWHAYENEQLKRHLQDDHADPVWVVRLYRFAWLRTFQLLIALAGAGVLAAGFEIKREHLQERIVQVEAELASLAIDGAAAPAQETSATPAESAQATPPSLAPRSEIEAVFNATDETSEQQAKLDALKQRYEELFVSHMFLKNCKLSEESDYFVINTALLQDMASLNAPGRLQYDIMTAAKGSYQEMYSRTPCSHAGTTKLSSNFNTYIASLKSRFSQP